MRAPTTSTLVVLLMALAITACDSNRSLRKEVERLGEQVAQSREQCDQARELETRDSNEVRQRLIRIGELRADEEWDKLVKRGEAGTAEMLIQAKRRMSDPDYQTKRDRELANLDREIALYKEDEPRRREDRQNACAALLLSNDAYRSAKAELTAATKSSH
ncbi:hypothetical protein KWH45_04335 [Xanthomonas campestris pv. mirabilis]|uniref:hypothetical protein n=1 Tax=Xanthomonas euvesicatoria TaxID=456327 RepID=UPI001C48A34C|nr:hypothetical protein [Xanthomonas euvesicatoria]MBV6852675.1 hypothetical protein [Xanthomonas campestris pv. mirabilis]